jgi:transposase InsO family protein
VIWALDQLIQWRGRTTVFRCANGPEYISHEKLDWVKDRGVHIEFIQPDNPQQNAHVERFNRTLPSCGSANITAHHLRKFMTIPLHGCGVTTITAHTWRWAK